MATTKKKSSKLKEPVKVRTKRLANGSESYYLDIYVDGKRSYEFLKLYHLPELNGLIKEQNRATKAAVETIKAKRIIELTNVKAGLKKTAVRSKLLLSDWMATYLAEQEHKGMRGLKLPKNHHPHAWAVRQESQDAGHQQGVVPQVHQNPIMTLAPNERMRVPESKREYLTIDEIKKLIETDCPREDVKRAYLFACYCGLRLSDVYALRWKDIVLDGGQYRVSVIMKKTTTPIYLPLSKHAMRWLPERNDAGDNEAVFAGLPCEVNINIALGKWVEAAGIHKHITFHTSRHTHATMMLTLGADLYTVSKLLGHANVKTTQIYAKIVDSKKVEAVNLVDSVFD